VINIKRKKEMKKGRRRKRRSAYQDSVVGVDDVEELGHTGKWVTEGTVGGNEVGGCLVLLFGNLSHVLSSVVGNENLDICDDRE
jgi:hypothetical protein